MGWIKYGLDYTKYSWYIDFSKLLDGFVKTDMWISLSCQVKAEGRDKWVKAED